MSTMKVSSALKAVELRQMPPPLIIGERINTQGSRKAKSLVLDDDFDGLVELARQQVQDGAHCLDVCVATTERSDETEFLKKLVKQISLEVDAPLVVDSTDPDAIISTIEQIPGRPIINSINLEGDGTRFHKLAPVMARYGIPAVALCIGPNGMAKTPQEKVNTATLLFETGKKYGLKPEQFIFDVLTFTLATGEDEFSDAGKNTLEGIKLVKEKFPDAYTTIGLSNISFGLAPHARKILNSVFLYHAVKAGLDSAIVNAREIIPYQEIEQKQRELAEDLIYNKHPNALSNLITHFESISPDATKSTRAEEIDQSWSPGKRCNFRIINRLKDGIKDDVVQAIAEKIDKDNIIKSNDKGIFLDLPKSITHQGAIRTLNEDLLPAMKEVGDKFGAGEIILPFVLKSAECMKSAVEELEKYLEREEGTAKGKFVLGTVYGDVHDIGKNLVKTIFENNGYEVHDLGKQVPIQKFIDEIKEVKPDAVGLSALLVSTSKQMQNFVNYVKKNDIQIPILCGGAAINSNYINRIAKEDGIYKSGVFYCKTMFEGLKTMDTLLSEEKDAFMSEWIKKIDSWQEKTKIQSEEELPHSGIKPAHPPKIELINKITRLNGNDFDLEEVWKYLNKKSLFVLSWGIRGNAAKQSEIEQDKLLEEWKKKVTDNDLFELQAVYGYFKSQNNGQQLVVKHPDGREIKFDFPRSTKSKHLCITDYFGKEDIVGFQAVTVGRKVSELIEQWDKEGNYTDAYYLHGLAVETAEALADLINQRIRNELGLEANRGLRYSWGYPSCPDTEQHKLVWDLLDAKESGMDLTEAGQIIPDQSTAAIVVHHPDAEYFVI